MAGLEVIIHHVEEYSVVELYRLIDDLAHRSSFDPARSHLVPVAPPGHSAQTEQTDQRAKVHETDDDDTTGGD
jgi:hypothetical protein